MTIADWQGIIGLILGIAAVAGIIFTILRFYIRAFAKQELEDIRHELKPNSGSSLKDQVTRLEESVKVLERNHKETHDTLKDQDQKITKIYETLIDYVTRVSSK